MIYILIHMEVENNKIIFNSDLITVAPLISNGVWRL